MDVADAHGEQVDARRLDEPRGLVGIGERDLVARLVGGAAGEHAQLGLYQLAVESGAVDALLPDGVTSRSGGAELWQLRAGSGASAKVQHQAVQTPDDDGWTLAQRQAAAAAGRILGEDFSATPDDKICRVCPFRSMCPAHTTAAVIE